MEIISIKKDNQYLEEYIKLCNQEWGTRRDDMKSYIQEKKNKILKTDAALAILGLIEDDNLIGFISLLKEDGEDRKDLTPWYATIYVKKEYRNKGYSKILNDAIIEEARKLGYDKIYLKTELVNYYEKFGAKYLEKLNNKEKLYYFEIENR